MLSIIFAVLLIVAGVVVGIYMRQKAKSCEEEAGKREEKAKQYESEGWTRDIREERDAANAYRTQASQYKHKASLPVFGGIVLAVVVLIISMIAIVPTGHTGVKVTFGNVEDGVLDSGLNFVMPWQNVVNMDNREQKIPFALEAFSKDIQQVDVQGSVNINIDRATAMNLYKNVGQNYMEILVQPRIQEDVKIIIAKYTAENLIGNRQNAADAIFELIKNELADKGINVISFAIENIDFTDAFESAVEAKQVATQRKLTAETEQAQKTMEEEAAAKRAIIAENAKAEQAVIAAKADLEVVQIQAEASLYAGQREAEMNQRIAEALTSDLIKYYLIKQWDGKLPVVTSNGMNILDMNDMIEGVQNAEQ